MSEEQRRPKGKEQQILNKAGAERWKRRGKLNRQQRRFSPLLFLQNAPLLPTQPLFAFFSKGH
jgi:hypothetical protein